MNSRKIKLTFLLLSFTIASIYFLVTDIFVFQKISLDDEGAFLGIFFYSYIGLLLFLLPSSLMYIAYGIIGKKQISNPKKKYILDAEILLISLLIISPYYSIHFYFTNKWFDSYLHFRGNNQKN